MRILIVFLALVFAPFANAQRRGDFTPAETAELRAIFADLADARASITAAERRLVDLVLGHNAPPVDPPVRPVDPPVRPVDPPVEPPASTWPDLPFDAPAIPEYEIPELGDCDWIVENGRAVSMRGLDAIDGVNLIAPAYRASIAAGHETPITVGVWDDAGVVVPGGQWHPDNDRSISIADGQGGYLDVELEVVGLDDSCEVSITWSKRWGWPAYIGVFNIGLRGQSDSFIIRANDGIGRLIMDGCWWLASKKHTAGQMHASGMHVDEWDTLIWRRHQFRGVLPTDPGTLVREHSAYFKSCVGTGPDAGTWIVGNNLLGGNRTGFQKRPQPGNNPRPTGPIVIADNFADGYGWTHGSDPSSSDGGGCLTSWVGPESSVYVFGNRITDARYACLTISGQDPSRNWLNDDGHPIANVYVYDNVFESNRASRGAVSISAAGEVHLYENDIDGPLNGDLKLDSAWNNRVNGIELGLIAIHGEAALDLIKALDSVKTFDPNDPSKKNEIQITDETLDSYLVR